MKKVTIRGRADNVAKCKEAIKQMLEEAVAPQVTNSKPVAAGMVVAAVPAAVVGHGQQ